jgi:DNA polymerase III subunit beta
VRLEFADGSVALSAGGEDEGRAEEQLEVGYEGEPITTAFNPQFLLDGLGALSSGSARLLFTSSNKPVVLRPDASGADTGDYTYLIMPVRLPG